MTQPQTALVLRRLREAGPAGVTAYDFLRDGIYRAGARVYDLRRLGYVIETENHRGRTARYRLIETVTREVRRTDVLTIRDALALKTGTYRGRVTHKEND